MNDCIAYYKREVELMNDILEQAVAHGADQGGSYEQNEANLIAAVNNWLKFRNLDELFEIARVDGRGQYYCKHQIIAKPEADALRKLTYDPIIANEYKNVADWWNHVKKK